MIECPDNQKLIVGQHDFYQLLQSSIAWTTPIQED